MEKALLNFSLILILVYFYKITRHGLHILQLENYYVDRYVVWMKRYIKKVINIKKIILLIVPIICFIINTKVSNIIGFVIEIFNLIYFSICFSKYIKLQNCFKYSKCLYYVCICICLYSKFNK